MSDEKSESEASPATVPTGSVGGTIDAPAKAPMGIVVGGTMSSGRTREIAEHEYRAELGRKKQDQMAALSRQGFHRGGLAKFTSMQLMDRGSPRLVLYYMRRDKTVAQECIAEITNSYVDGKPDPLFMMVCPRCLERHVPHGQCQMKIQNSHRRFHIDSRPFPEGVAGKTEKLFVIGEKEGDPYRPIWVVLAGTVTVDDIVRCEGNCGYAVRIDQSKVWEV
jgi:hypothetical protein